MISRGRGLGWRLRGTHPKFVYRGQNAWRQPREMQPGFRRAIIFCLVIPPLVVLMATGCSAMTATAGTLFTRAQVVLNRHAISRPSSERLDAGLPQTATILARDGSVLAEINDVRYGQRVSVPLEAISSNVIRATLAAEDRRFFKHQGVDPIGFARAIAQNAGSDSVASGASTLDMQLARNLLFPDERAEQTLGRKVKESIAALQLNRRYTKEEILEAYLNSVYYANMAYGIEAAAQRYFAKPASRLEVHEAALLAGIPQSPTNWDPIRHLNRAKERQEHILDLMVEAGFISTEKALEAKNERLGFQRPDEIPTRAPHWVNYIQYLVRERFGPEALFTEGVRVQTTLDPEIQALAESMVAAGEGARRRARANNSAMVVIDPRTGHILAMVGSKNFWDRSIDGQVNVTVAGRQPGSSIKPLVYLAGFERGLHPGVEVVDAVTAFPAPPAQPLYVPTNWENKFYGRITLRDALGNSLNVPAVKVLKYVGVSSLVDLSRRLGITTLDHWDPRWLSLTLGGGEVRLLELTGAYATIARLGERLPVEPFMKVENPRGDILYEPAARPRGEQVVDPRFAYQLLHVMGDVGARQVTFGPVSPLHLDRPHMMKTGTTDDFRDTWTVGCVPQACIGVWMGNTKNEAMVKTSSSLTAGQIWSDMMQALIRRYEWAPTPFPQPEGVVVTRVRNTTNGRPGGGDREEVLLPGQGERSMLEMDWSRW